MTRRLQLCKCDVENMSMSKTFNAWEWLLSLVVNEPIKRRSFFIFNIRWIRNGIASFHRKFFIIFLWFYKVNLCFRHFCTIEILTNLSLSRIYTIKTKKKHYFRYFVNMFSHYGQNNEYSNLKRSILKPVTLSPSRSRYCIHP